MPSPNPSNYKLHLTLHGLGHVPSFKNSKMILWRQKRIMTKPENQVWMEKAVQSFVLQLRSALATSETETMTAPIPLSRIALSLPLDDSRKWIPEHSVNTLLVCKGREGADVMIERI
jgi:hypothetical protein